MTGAFMADMEQPQLYLITPTEIDLNKFPSVLQRVLDVTDIACLRLSLGTSDAAAICRAGDRLREIAHARDISIILDTHRLLAQRLGLDGVHLRDSGRGLRKIRAEMGEDAIIGAHCGISRHDGMSAGEAGADYIAFGPVRESAMGDGDLAQTELFAWWSEIIEIPIVAEGALRVADIERLAPVTDFFAIGDEIWLQDDPVTAFKALIAPLQ